MAAKRRGKEKPKDVKQLAQEARKWVASPEGQQTLQEVFQRATEMTTQLRKARIVDPKSLHEPVTL
jgi:hypothetical protein